MFLAYTHPSDTGRRGVSLFDRSVVEEEVIDRRQTERMTHRAAYIYIYSGMGDSEARAAKHTHSPTLTNEGTWLGRRFNKKKRMVKKRDKNNNTKLQTTIVKEGQRSPILASTHNKTSTLMAITFRPYR